VLNVDPPKALPSAVQYWYSDSLLGFEVPVTKASCSGRHVFEREQGDDVEELEELRPGDEKRQTSTAYRTLSKKEAISGNSLFMSKTENVDLHKYQPTSVCDPFTAVLF
jgi:hypothetical protein